MSSASSKLSMQDTHLPEDIMRDLRGACVDEIHLHGDSLVNSEGEGVAKHRATQSPLAHRHWTHAHGRQVGSIGPRHRKVNQETAGLSGSELMLYNKYSIHLHTAIHD